MEAQTDQTTPDAPKSGYKSSEFATTVVVLAGLVTGALNGVLPAETAAMAGTALAALYTLARMAIKALHLKGRAANVPDLPDLGAK